MRLRNDDSINALTPCVFSYMVYNTYKKDVSLYLSYVYVGVVSLSAGASFLYGFLAILFPPIIVDTTILKSCQIRKTTKKKGHSRRRVAFQTTGEPWRWSTDYAVPSCVNLRNIIKHIN